MSDEKIQTLIEAKQYLECFSKSDINEIRTLKSPPADVMYCIEAVYILLNGSKPSDWRTCLNMLRRPSFIRDLCNFDVENGVSDTTMKELEQYVNNARFQLEVVTKNSMATRGLCQWVRGVYNYQLIKKAN